MLIDTHAHFDKYTDEEIDLIVEAMKDSIIIASGCDRKTNEQVIKLIDKYHNIYGTIGMHPTEISNMQSDDFEYLIENINHPKIVGIGETGLDYYWDDSNKEIQKELFIKHIELAKKYNKVVVIHSRNAIEDVYDILNNNIGESKVILHCFNENLDWAKKFMKFNIKFGVGGILTFKNAYELREVVSKISTEYFILETDSPYLTPSPYRGKKNSPEFVKFIAKKFAEIKNLDYENAVEKTGQNAIKQFDLNRDL